MHEPPSRIICLTEETVETLYLLGEQDRIAGISMFAVRPSQAKIEKQVVSAFTEADMKTIIDLDPDLVIGFSDIQADIALKLIKAGLNVVVFNQRSVEEILTTIEVTGRIVGAGGKARKLATELRHHMAKNDRRKEMIKPKVYFEEWDKPRISAIRWVSELITMAGGVDIFETLSFSKSAKGRIIEDDQAIIREDPDIYIASWCGKPFNKDTLIKRKGWEKIKAIKEGNIFEIDSSLILQPGPAALTDGLDTLIGIFDKWRSARIVK